MNREILFRGQTHKRGEKVRMDGAPVDGHWVYGGIFPGEGDFSIIYSSGPIEKHVVHTDTVGQYTGLTDKNGAKIFEGDIVRHYNRADKPESYSQGVIYWDRRRCQWRRTTVANDYNTFDVKADCIYEVIGNIHDNPELMGGEDDG